MGVLKCLANWSLPTKCCSGYKRARARTNSARLRELPIEFIGEQLLGSVDGAGTKLKLTWLRLPGADRFIRAKAATGQWRN